MRKPTFLLSCALTMCLPIAALAQPSTTTTFTAASNAQTNNDANWSNGLPSLTNPGLIDRDANVNEGPVGWIVVHTSGRVSSGFNRNFGGGTEWYMTGGEVVFFNAGSGNWTNWNSAAGGYTLTISGGTFDANVIQTTNNSTLNMKGGSVVLRGNLNNNGGTVVFGIGDGSITASSMSNSEGVINFLTGSAGSLTLAGFNANNYEGLWNQSILRIDGANNGTFSDHFAVTGSTLALTGTPVDPDPDPDPDPEPDPDPDPNPDIEILPKPPSTVNTSFTADTGLALVNAENWSNGFPESGIAGGITRDGNFNDSVSGWTVVHSSGRIGSNFNRAFGGGTEWFMTGGELVFFNAGNGNWNNWNAGVGGYTLNVSGGTFQAATIQTNNSRLNVTGGTIQLQNNLNNNGGVTTFGIGFGALSASQMSNAGGRVNFLAGSGGSLTISGFGANNYEGLWNQGILQYNGSNNGAFNQWFSVDGATLRLAAEPVTPDPEPDPDPTPPATPSGLAATFNNIDRVIFSWTRNSADETGFRIERAVGSGGSFSLLATVGASVTSHADTAVSPGIRYDYRVRAENAQGPSAWSNVATVTIPPPAVDPNPDPHHPDIVPHGYVSVRAFGADSTGTADATAAIQAGINYARDNNRVLWFPAGTYLVSARLEVDQPNNNAAFPGVLMGSTIDPHNRPTIRLAPNSPGFNNPNSRRAVLHFFNVGTADNESGNTDLYNQAVIGIDFEIGAGNNGAVALRMQGAEGCTIEDVRIDLTEGGHTGIWGIPASGGATHGVTVIGGAIGIDTRTTSLGGGGSQPSPTVTGSTFINQSERAVYASARGSLVMVGCHFERNTTGPLFTILRHWAGQPFDGSLQLIDCTIEYASYAAVNSVVEMAGGIGRSFYFDNTYIRNARRVYSAEIPSNNNGWTHFWRLAVHVKPDARPWGQPTEPVYIDGINSGDLHIVSEDGPTPPADLLTRHQLPANFPSWEIPGAVNVLDLGAAGNGTTDDWAILQEAINSHEVVFLPAGTYAVSRTLDLHPRTKIIGSHPSFTAITALSTLSNPFNGVQDGEPDAPIVRTADVAGAETWLAFFQIRRLYPLAQHNPTPPGNFALEWRSGGDSLVRQLKVESRTATNFRPDFAAGNFYGINIIDNPINTFHPQQSFGDGQWAWPNADPNVLITGNGGGRWYTFWVHGRQALRQETPFLRVLDTVEPLHIYHLHLQQQDSRNHAEFIGARNVSVYNTKGEIKGALLYFEDCDNVRVFGNGGLTSPDPDYFDPYLFRFVNTTNFLISGQADTINEGETRWIGGVFDRWIHANLLTWFSIQDASDGRPDVIVPSSERPILYLRGEPGIERFTPVEPENPWFTGTHVGDGWYFLDGFGLYFPMRNGFAWHTEHGLLYSVDPTFASLWIWHSRAGWIYTSASLYPFVYRADTERWLYYLIGGTPSTLFFFDLVDRQWFQL